VHARDAAAQGDPEVSPEKAPGKPRHPEDEDATKRRRKRKKTPDAACTYSRRRLHLFPTPPASIPDDTTAGRLPSRRVSRRRVVRTPSPPAPRGRCSLTWPSRPRTRTPPPGRATRRRESARRSLSRDQPV
jgi:hypothetical protein